jgi:hypothetical protein
MFEHEQMLSLHSVARMAQRLVACTVNPHAMCGRFARTHRTHFMKETKQKKPSATQTSLVDPTLLKQAVEAADDVVRQARMEAFNDTSPERCFTHFRVLAEGVAVEGLLPFRGVPLVMHANAQQALTTVAPALPVAVASLRAPRIHEIFELPPLILALHFAAGRVAGTKVSNGEIASLLAEQTPQRTAMLHFLDAVSHPVVGLVPRERVVAIREGSGPLDRAEDFVDIAGLFNEYASVLQGKHPFSEAQIARIGEVGSALLQQMRPGNAPRELAQRSPESVLRDQFAALVNERYEHLLTVATLHFGRAKTDAIVPALYATVRATKNDAAKNGAAPAPPV